MGRKPVRWQHYFPGVVALSHYDRKWLRGDVLAGLSVAAYLIPQVMAYAEIAGVPAVVGLWTVPSTLLVYAVLGTSSQLSVGPESTTALMTAAGVGALIGLAGGARYAEVAALLALAVGLVCLGGWLLRLGFLANLLSRPVLIGYLVGIAMLMIISQLGEVFRLPAQGNGVLAGAWSVLSQLSGVHLPTLLVALVVLLLLFGLRWRFPRLPGPLIVLLIAAAVVSWFGLQRYGLNMVGAVPTGLPSFRLPIVGIDLFTLFPYAIGIAVVGYSDNVLTGRAFASKRGEQVDPDQELLALGGANLAAGLFQGFPVSSSASRTVIGDMIGSRTQLHSLVAAGCVVATLLFAGPVLASFPQAALGALVIYAAIGLVDLAEIKRIARFRKSELILSLITAVAVVWLGVLAGIGLAVALSLLDLIRRISHPHAGVLGYVPGVAGMHGIDDYAQAKQLSGLVVYRYDSPLFFANSEDFLTRSIEVLTQAEQPVYWFLLNAEANVEVDLTAVDTLIELHKRVNARGIYFALARVKQEVHDQLARAGFTQLVGEDHIFATLPTAVAAYARWYRDKFHQLPTGLPKEILIDPIQTESEKNPADSNQPD